MTPALLYRQGSLEVRAPSAITPLPASRLTTWAPPRTACSRFAAANRRPKPFYSGRHHRSVPPQLPPPPNKTQ
jgi:hypothetical protein